MLSFRFELTPRQCEMLLTMYAGHYKEIDKSGLFLPEFDSSNFVGIGMKLIAKGLIDHDPNRSPTWMITDRGVAIAETILDDARRMAAKYGKRKPIETKARK